MNAWNFIDIAGNRYGRLVVLRRSSGVRKRVYWRTICDCGTEKDISAAHLRRNLIQSCGCLRRENGVRHKQTHGLSHSREYIVWGSMIDRCRNPNNSRYADWGGRGIQVCDRWSSFENFLADLGPRPSRFHSIERKNNDGNYDPENVFWATRKQQNRNTRRTHWVVVNGERISLAQAVEDLGLRYGTVMQRLRNGWPAYQALELRA